MFDSEFRFQGIHAEKAIKLSEPYNDNGDRILPRTVDLLMLAPIVGFLYQRRPAVDKQNDKERKIFVGQLVNNKPDIMYVFSTIMLLDDEYEPDVQKRVEKAFAGQNTKEDEERFISYVRGGVDIIYDKIMGGDALPKDYLTRFFDLLDDMKNRHSFDLDRDSFLELCSRFE